ncbi:hypothetical protein ACTXN7_11615 [Corynebacterium flavescens]|uniref:hypothetical protein n=1 Tax=Corynebacterium flavescens TaxID=28028 RepID=UPI003FD62BFC
MFTICNRIDSKKTFHWTADIITGERFSHRVSTWVENGYVHCRIKSVDGEILAEKAWDNTTPPRNEDISDWVKMTMTLAIRSAK